MDNRKEFIEFTLKIEMIPPPRCSRSRLSVTCSCCRKQVEPSRAGCHGIRHLRGVHQTPLEVGAN